LSGEALLKGMICGGLGLFLATIGLDPMSGIQRYTFGQIFLWDGIGLVPITIGFFAIPEIIDLAVTGSSIAGEKVGKLGGVMEGVKDTFRHFWLVICTVEASCCHSGLELPQQWRRPWVKFARQGTAGERRARVGRSRQRSTLEAA
jgi:TctA family transporter